MDNLDKAQQETKSIKEAITSLLMILAFLTTTIINLSQQIQTLWVTQVIIITMYTRLRVVSSDREKLKEQREEMVALAKIEDMEDQRTQVQALMKV